MSHRFAKKQLQALSMLADGMSITQIGYQLKLRRGTIARWKEIPEFMQEYNKTMHDVHINLKNKAIEAFNTTIERITYEVGGGYSDPKRIESYLNILKTLEKSCDNAQ